MSKKKFNQEDDSGGGGGGWLTTFSDLMSLLLTFFILLYSMSDVDAKKFEAISNSLQSVLSGVGTPSPIVTSMPSGDANTDLDLDIDIDLDKLGINAGILAMEEKVSDYVDEQGLAAEVTVSMNKRGVFVDIKEAILFDPGSANLKPGGEVVLQKLEGLVNDFENDLVIEGHTDDIPMNTAQYPSNWHLSTARAISVLTHMVEYENVDPTRLSAVGYGEYNPILPNDSPENKAANRRVNILIIFDEESDGINNGG